MKDSEALARKNRSESLLRAQGIPFIDHLPAIESSGEALRRSKEEVAWRAMALVIVASKAIGTLEGDDTAPAFMREVAKRYGLDNHFSPIEQTFMENDAPSEFELIQLSWRDEAACTLFWALAYIEELGFPTKQLDFWGAVKLMKTRSCAEFIRDAELRPMDEILDQADLIYRYHWAAKDRGQEERDPPAGLDRSVVRERHYALNWLIGYCDQPWDEVSTDT